MMGMSIHTIFMLSLVSMATIYTVNNTALRGVIKGKA
jgi:hypothetical protein